MTTNRLFGRAAGSVQERRFRLLLCLAVLSLATCKAPEKAPQVTDSGLRDTTPGSPSDAIKDGLDAKPTDTALSQACKGDAGPPTKGKGESCMCDGECRTAHCIDGVCCSSVCDDRCKACNLPSSLGDCTLIAAGGSPTDPLECTKAAEATCGQDGKCDGNGGCRLYVSNTYCDPGICDGDGLVGIKTCDGKGKCEGNIGRSCAPYSCDPRTNECDKRCTTTAQCALGQQCSGGSCGMKFNGYPCDTDDECASGYCTDGYCCNVACSGPCVSCVLPGSLGRCQLVPAGQKSEDCPEEPQSSCGTTGYCDGAGTCALWPADTTPCATSSCASPTLLNATAVCDGKGACQEPQLLDCSPNLCVAGACTTTCRSDADCEPGHACVFELGSPLGTCGKKQNGQPCAEADECTSDQCVDGVCCESTCAGPCRSCALPGSPGRCVNLPAGARDPRQTCSDEGAVSCGQDGLCDGNGACQVYPVGTRCGDPSCNLGSFTDAPACNQAGQCVAPPSRSCSPFVCNGNTCYSSCTKDTDCVPPNTCVNNSCGKGELGAACSSGSDCDSGFCAQGVCCNSACTDACRACNLAATMGFCTAVPNGAPDPQEKCLVTDKATCGTTGACWWGTCAYVASGTTCKPASCVNISSLTPASTCDGMGSCVTPAVVSCGTFTCRNNSCLVACATDSDCLSPTTCVNHSCGLKANGAACTTGTQCSSGFCTEGVCCNSACSDTPTGGLCASCKVTGRVGTCSAVPDGQADPKQRCVASSPASGDCSFDGTCNGRGACRPWSTATGCRLATCVGSAYTPAANCDGSGRCPIVSSFSCAPYKCNPTSPSCLTTCTSSNDCLDGVTCLQTNNTCGNKLPNGQACKANSDCASENCVGGQMCCAANSCFVDGQCRAAGATNPNNVCQQCTPGTSTTAWSPKATGTTCNDNVACTHTDICTNGACHGTAYSCNDNLACTTDVCNGDNTCAHTPTAGNCAIAGDCYASGVTNPSNLCQQCRPSLSATTWSPAAGSPTCDDGNLCTRNDVCSNGACAGTAYSCDDGLACTTDACLGDGTCTHTPVNACVFNGACYADGHDHPTNPCQVCTGTTWTNKPAGTSCNDGNLCTRDDVCTGGVCAGTAYSCDDGLACTTDACLGDGGCTHTPENACLFNNTCYANGQDHPTNPCQVCSGTTWTNKPAGTSCNDGNLCTRDDVCTGGVCGGTAYSCDDGLACTTDACLGDGGCTHTPVNACVFNNTCYADGHDHPTNPCQVCTGTTWTNKPAGTSCNDGDPCTWNDVCSGAVCGGTAYSCNDNLSCTTDVCNGNNTCTHTVTVGCLIGATPTCYAAGDNPANPCQACVPSTSTTTWTPKADNTSCNDGDMCHTGKTCTDGACTGGTEVICDAGACVPSTGCPP